MVGMLPLVLLCNFSPWTGNTSDLAGARYRHDSQ